MVNVGSSRNPYVFRVLCLLAVLSLVGCGGLKVCPLERQPECGTTVEGFYYCAEPWDGPKPALIVRSGPEIRILKGTIVSRDERGITFDQSAEGMLRDPGPEHFPFKRVAALIGENGDVVYGRVPESCSKAYTLELHLRLADSPKAEVIKLSLKPNAQFAFCVPPGTYEVSDMRFINEQLKIVDGAVEPPRVRVVIEEGFSNYIGDWYMNCGPSPSDSIKVAYKIIRRPSEIMSEMAAAAVLGAVAPTSTSIIRQAVIDQTTQAVASSLVAGAPLPKGAVGQHRFSIIGRDSYPKKGVGPIKVNIAAVRTAD